MELLPEIVALKEEMTRWRHDIHKHPDHEMHDLRTASKIAELLRSFRFDEVIERFGQCGVVGVLRHGEGPIMGLIAGMTGQSIQEENPEIDYQSIIGNTMHAAGQDGEIAMLLGAAKYLAKERPFSGTIVMIFSAWEDCCYGPQSMVEEGLLQKFPLEVIYSLRSLPGLPIGNAAIVSGPVMAAVSEILIKIEGVSGHSGMLNHAHNPIISAAEIVHSLGGLVASEFEPGSPVVISISSFTAGNSFSYIPAKAELKGSVRFLNDSIQEWLPHRIESRVQDISKSYGVHVSMSYRSVCPVTINNQEAIDFARRIAVELLGKENIEESHPPSMLGYGAATFLREVKGAIIQVGNGNHTNGLMSSHYNFNDEALTMGTSLLVALVKGYLKK